MGARSRFVGAAAFSIIPVVIGATIDVFVTTGIATAISMFWVSVAARFDMMWRQLPDALVVLAFLPTAMAAAALTLQGSTTATTGIGFGALVWAIPLLVVHLVAPSLIGFGDVKAAAAIGAMLGLTQDALVVASGLLVAALVASVVALTSRRRDVALGPCFAGAAIACLAAGALAGEVA